MFNQSNRLRAVTAAALVLSAAACGRIGAGERAVLVPPPTVDETATAATSEKAVLAGGCFWGVQGVFQHVKGVSQAISGYTGGNASSAHYEDVGLGTTGHAESVQVTFDPRVISYGEILRIYFSVAHDPTQKNRQGPDTGTQYRSAIFPRDESQKKIADAYVAQLDAAKTFGAPLATTIEPGKTFYRAEDYHQDFLVQNPSYPYIVVNDLPKIENLRKMFPDRYASEPALTAVSVSVR
ncbi:MAG TPA: peptide-methionine (S)-S-oxide reductase MsrA [Rhodanobacteraceae bacterium]|nr:peptide-methionine (S)-S-oxide reductase MsrA [Rhodanobacteraceae bacterium]